MNLRTEAETLLARATECALFADHDHFVAGSVALDSLAWRDLDVNLRFADAERVFALGRRVLAHLEPVWFELRHAEGETDSPGIYFVGFETRITGELWNVDLWFQDGPAYEASRAWLEAMKARLTPGLAAQAVAVKQALLVQGSYGKTCASVDVYRAVLDADVRDLASFRIWQTARG